MQAVGKTKDIRQAVEAELTFDPLVDAANIGAAGMFPSQPAGAARNRSAMNVEPPASSGDTTLTMIPFTWNSGSTSRLRVSPAISNHLTMISAVALMLAWSSLTPLGRPVVPLV
jgi:hypothetical protein